MHYKGRELEMFQSVLDKYIPRPPLVDSCGGEPALHDLARHEVPNDLIEAPTAFGFWLVFGNPLLPKHGTVSIEKLRDDIGKVMRFLLIRFHFVHSSIEVKELNHSAQIVQVTLPHGCLQLQPQLNMEGNCRICREKGL